MLKVCDTKKLIISDIKLSVTEINILTDNDLDFKFNSWHPPHVTPL